MSERTDTIPDEQAVLGFMLRHGEAWHTRCGVELAHCAYQLEPAHFGAPLHALLFEAMQYRANEGQAFGPRAVVELVGMVEDDAALLDELGGIAYLHDLARACPDEAGVMVAANALSAALPVNSAPLFPTMH